MVHSPRFAADLTAGAKCRMKVAIITSFPRDLNRPHGGVEAVSVNLLCALATRPDVEVHVVTTDNTIVGNELYPLQVSSSRSLLPASRPSPIDPGSVIVHRLAAPRSPLLAYAIGRGRRQMEAYLRQLRPDVVHAHDFYGLMTRGLALPRVFTIHGFIHEDTRYAGGLSAWLRSWLWRCFETRCWREQPHIVSISPYVRERLRGIARGVIHDIENPITEECFEVKRSEEPGTIFCAAAICKRKNTLSLIQATHLLVQQGMAVRLRWAGTSTEPHYEASVQKYVANHALTEKVRFLGRLTGEEVRAELAKASVFALVSFEEGAPMGIAEAMAAGVPVVASNRCGMPYMVRDSEAGFLVGPENAGEIAHRLRQLLGNAELRQTMGQAGSAFARERFQPDRVAQRTLRVYRAAIDSTMRSC